MNTRKILQWLLSVFILFSFVSQAQDLPPENTSLSSLMSYETNPMDLYTGVANVGIPVYQLPTYSQTIAANISLRYNPSNIAKNDSISGNCGRGWTLFDGGAIVRRAIGDPDEMGWARGNTYNNSTDIYQFNFMGYSGKFQVLMTSSAPYTLYAVMGENSGAPLSISIDYNQSTFVINTITIYDDLGNRYIFSDQDKYVYIGYVVTNGNTVESRANTTSSFHLTTVKDNNDAALLNFAYNTYSKVETYHHTGESNVTKEIKEIVSPGFGKITFANSLYPSTVYDRSLRFTQLIISDFKANPVKRIDFVYDAYNNLIQVDQSDFAKTKTLSHKLYYRAPGIIANNDVIDVDSWGYYNKTDKWCFYEFWYGYTGPQRAKNSHLANPAYCTRGVLEKMILPTGGCIVYQYESNTYSYRQGESLEYIDNFTNLQTPLNTNVFNELCGENVHNFQATNFSSHTFNVTDTTSASNIHNFSVSGTQTLYFKFDSAGYMVELSEGNPQLSYPTFELLDSANNIIGTFAHNNSTYGFNNGMNAKMGSSFTLNTGDYKIRKIPNGLVNGIVQINTVSLISNPQKVRYGYGVRIKKIGYFADGTINQKYYDNPPAIIPDREISYSYNFFNEPNRSSGSTVPFVATYMSEYKGHMGVPDPIYYKNVTVTESGGNGKTEYDFFNPIDYPTYGSFDRFKLGSIKSIKKYNATGDLVQSTENFYEYHDIGNFDPQPLQIGAPFKLGWVRPIQIKEKKYYPSGHFSETVSDLTYNNVNRKVSTHSQTNSITGDNIITKYFYHNGNSVFSQNRISEIEKVEVYNNTELLSVNKVNFSNSWPQLALTFPNSTYLTQTTQVGKSTQALQTKTAYNAYDSFGHPLEVVQENGMKVVYIYGYQDSQIIAKIENIDYNSIPSTLITNAKSASDNGSEASLLTALIALRNDPALSNSLVTTYTYKPLIGISSVTDPNGVIVKYEYDESNRVVFVKDGENKILSQKQYNYKTQN